MPLGVHRGNEVFYRHVGIFGWVTNRSRRHPVTADRMLMPLHEHNIEWLAKSGWLIEDNFEAE